LAREVRSFRCEVGVLLCVWPIGDFSGAHFSIALTKYRMSFFQNIANIAQYVLPLLNKW
jgi:hypothetical protein